MEIVKIISDQVEIEDRLRQFGKVFPSLPDSRSFMRVLMALFDYDKGLFYSLVIHGIYKVLVPQGLLNLAQLAAEFKRVPVGFVVRGEGDQGRIEFMGGPCENRITCIVDVGGVPVDEVRAFMTKVWAEHRITDALAAMGGGIPKTPIAA